jgi:hypothetical protein
MKRETVLKISEIEKLMCYILFGRVNGEKVLKIATKNEKKISSKK